MDDTDLLTADTNTQSSIKEQLNTLIDNYESKVEAMRILYKDISTSSSWKDTNIKDSFLNQLDNYIKLFESLSTTMSNQVNKLSISTSEVDTIESIFS